ncbi:MAG: aminopeptidase [Pseudomonadota bacterium]
MSRRRAFWTVALMLVLAAVGGLAGCGSVSYLAQSVGGHLSLMNAARPVQDWVNDPQTPQPLRERLQLADRMRDFSVSELRLPDNNSYRRFAELDRTAAVWNVVAAPELSLKLKTACFPVVGCVGYRGYFDRADADQEAERLRKQGLEVYVYGVPAYSTLGWTNWFGGDPLLSTFIRYPEGELARMIFHELAHQVAYAKDDTMFNESFATSVEVIGGQRWLQQHASAEAREEYARYDGRRRDFRALTRAYRDRLEAVFRSDLPDADKRVRKAELMQQMRAEYARLKAERWGGYAGYDRWFEQANNAALGVLSAYDELVPHFQRLFEREGGDFDRFYAEVKRLAQLPKSERRAKLGPPP